MTLVDILCILTKQLSGPVGGCAGLKILVGGKAGWTVDTQNRDEQYWIHPMPGENTRK